MNNELIERIDQEIQNLMGQRDVIERLLPNNTAVRELTQIIKVLKDCKAALSEPVAEPVASSKDVEEFIRLHGYELAWHSYTEYCVSQDDLRQWMAGHARVPVDVLETILEVVRGKLNEAYQNAMPVCCGQPGQECCGNPVAEWKPSDIELMDSLGPVEKTISAMLTASKEPHNE